MKDFIKLGVKYLFLTSLCNLLQCLTTVFCSDGISCVLTCVHCLLFCQWVLLRRLNLLNLRLLMQHILQNLNHLHGLFLDSLQCVCCTGEPRTGYSTPGGAHQWEVRGEESSASALLNAAQDGGCCWPLPQGDIAGL